VTRQEWLTLAKALAAERAKIEAEWPPKGGYMANANDAQHRRLIREAKLSAFDTAVRAVCRVLASRSVRFDPQRFVAIAMGRKRHPGTSRVSDDTERWTFRALLRHCDCRARRGVCQAGTGKGRRKLG
jgi:hypothetical protein